MPDATRWSRQLERIEALSRKLSRSREVISVAEAVASEIDSVGKGFDSLDGQLGQLKTSASDFVAKVAA